MLYDDKKILITLHEKFKRLINLKEITLIQQL